PSAERTFPEQLGRQVGLTVRAGIKGVTVLPEMVGNALGLRSSEAVDALLGKVLPHPQNAVERISGDVAAAMGGQGAIAKGDGLVTRVGGPVISRLMVLIRTDPGLKVTSAGPGTL